MSTGAGRFAAITNNAAGRIRGLYYGWWVALAGGLAMMLTVGPLQQGGSALFTAIEAEFGWSRAMVTGAASAGQFARAILAPAQGALVDRLGPGRLVLAGLSAAGIAAILLSLVHHPVFYYAAFMLMFAGVGMGAFMPSMTAVNRWLVKRRATGMAFVMGGSSIGGVLVPAMAWGITAHGWRPTIAALGVILLVAAPVLGQIIGRRPPQDEQTQGGGDGKAGAAQAPAPDEGFTAREALRTWTFWAMAGSHALANLSVAAVAAHLILHLTDNGLSLGVASLLLPVIGVTAFSGRIIGGQAGDRANRRLTTAFFMTLQGVAMLVLAFVTTFWMAVVFAVLWGIGFGARGPVFHALRGDYFGRRAYATILGLSSFILSLGMTVSPVAVGWVFDQQNTYLWAFLALAAASFAAAALILTARRPVQV